MNWWLGAAGFVVGFVAGMLVCLILAWRRRAEHDDYADFDGYADPGWHCALCDEQEEDEGLEEEDYYPGPWDE